jgi:hypothetical protein
MIVPFAWELINEKITGCNGEKRGRTNCPITCSEEVAVQPVRVWEWWCTFGWLYANYDAGLIVTGRSPELAPPTSSA